MIDWLDALRKYLKGPSSNADPNAWTAPPPSPGADPELPPNPPPMDPDVEISASEPDITTFDVSEPVVGLPHDRPGGYSGGKSPGLVSAKLDVQRRAQAGGDTPVAPYPDDFVGPKQPVGPEYRPEFGPEYRPDLLKMSPGDVTQKGDIQSRASSAPKPTGPMGPEYRPDLLGIEQPQPQAQPAAPQMQRSAPESAPYDNSAWYAALRDMANAGGLAKSMGMEPGLAYYDTKLAQEKQKQKDWKDQLALRLKQQFEQDQQGREFAFKGKESGLEREFKGKEGGLDRSSREGIAARNLASEEARAIAADKRSWGQFNISKKQQDDQFQQGEKRRQESTDANNAEDALRRYPTRSELAASQSLLNTLDAGRVPKGWSKFMTIVQSMSSEKLKDIETALMNAKLTPQETREVVDVWGAANPSIKRMSGGQVTASEWLRNAMQLGIGFGQGEDATAYGLRRLAESNLEEAKRAWEGQSPGVQERLKNKGLNQSDWQRAKPATPSLLEQLKANGVE